MAALHTTACYTCETGANTLIANEAHTCETSRLITQAAGLALLCSEQNRSEPLGLNIPSTWWSWHLILLMREMMGLVEQFKILIGLAVRTFIKRIRYPCPSTLRGWQNSQ